MVSRKPPTAIELDASLRRVRPWLRDATVTASRTDIAAAVRASARYLAARHPGGSVEVRVPPFVAVQCIEGLNHRRGTPPNVVELAPRLWLLLATGRRTWAEAIASGEVLVSGSRADLSAVLPLL